MADADSVAIRQHLQQLLSSEPMEKSEASQKLLRYLAERALRGETPKETEIAIDVFGRDASFNSAEESLVRVAVRALRRRLHDYYTGPGQHDEVRFDIPKGGYRLDLRAARGRAGTGRDRGCRHSGKRAFSSGRLSPAAEPALDKPRNTWLRTWAVAATALLVCRGSSTRISG